MIINGKETKAEQFAYDGCHKIYLIEDLEDELEAKKIGYDLYPIDELEEKYNNSCSLRFINNWKLDKVFVGQFEEVIFE